MQLTFNLTTIKPAAETLWQYAKQYKVWAFHGEMGTGKTTFIHALCEVLGVSSAIGSPTYAIINEYAATRAGTIYHMDWYRLNSEDEAIQAGVEDCMYSGNLCLVEWPEKAEGLLPPDALHIFIKSVDENTRQITL
jgi:tRNA threonylcarbamoyladenosine biosynthesis protein TsaE